jgi:hypothetical protein
VIATGVLFDGAAECYVLDDGRRVISQRGILRALRGSGNGGGPGNADLARFLGRIPERFRHFEAVPEIEFDSPTGVANGREGRFLTDLCRAYAEAFAAGALHHTQARIASNAVRVLSAIASVGIEALIDEATGYQANRPRDYLARRLDRYLRTDPAAWERTFPPELVRALAPLYGLAYATGAYPLALRSAFGFIYDVVLGSEVAAELRRRNPDPRFGSNHHQFLRADVRRLVADDLRIIQVLAEQSASWSEFRARMLAHYRGAPLQLGLAKGVRS